MGLFSFIKDAGSKLFGGQDTEEVKQEKRHKDSQF